MCLIWQQTASIEFFECLSFFNANKFSHLVILALVNGDQCLAMKNIICCIDYARNKTELWFLHDSFSIIRTLSRVTF